MTVSVKRRVLSALGAGGPMAASRLRLESKCSDEDLLEISNLGFVRFRSPVGGVVNVCVTPKGVDFLAKQKHRR